MANVMFKVAIPVYAALMIKLEEVKNEAEIFRLAFTALEENSYITDNEDVNDANATVQIKIDSDYVGPVMGYCLNIIRGDGTISPAADDTIIRRNSYAAKLLDVYHARMDAKKAEEKRAAEYSAWLNKCFDKYVTSADEPSCKEIAVAINNGEGDHKYGHIKYQNIMKPLREYRERKFGKK